MRWWDQHRQIDAFELWYWRRLLRVPWTARQSKRSILREISSKYSLEGLMPKLKLQYFGHLMQRTDSLKKTLILGKIEGRRRRGEEDDRGWDYWMASPTQRTWVWASSGSWWWTGKPGVLQSMGSQRVEHNWVTELNWTEVMSNSLQPQGLQHARFPCPSLSPRAYSNSCTLRQWFYLTISSSIFPSIRVFSSELAPHIRWPKY